MTNPQSLVPGSEGESLSLLSPGTNDNILPLDPGSFSLADLTNAGSFGSTANLGLTNPNLGGSSSGQLNALLPAGSDLTQLDLLNNPTVPDDGSNSLAFANLGTLDGGSTDVSGANPVPDVGGAPLNPNPLDLSSPSADFSAFVPLDDGNFVASVGGDGGSDFTDFLSWRSFFFRF